MTTSSSSSGGKEKLTRYTFKATWQAIRFVRCDHFPLILPGVHPLASFFILRRLKHLGYSNCRVTTSNKGLVVFAHR
jgi:hypothetical protein